MATIVDKLIEIGWPTTIANDLGLERTALADFQGMNCFASLNRERLKVDGVGGKQSLYLLDKAVEDGLCSPHFLFQEFRCPCPITWIDASRYIIDHLEIARYTLDTSIYVVSGHRTDEHNDAVGGAAGSYHTCKPRSSSPGPGCDTSAVDIVSDEVKLTYRTARDLGFRGGIGVVLSTGYVRHLDDGPRRQWGYNTQGQAVAYA